MIEINKFYEQGRKEILAEFKEITKNNLKNDQFSVITIKNTANFMTFILLLRKYLNYI